MGRQTRPASVDAIVERECAAFRARLLEALDGHARAFGATATRALGSPRAPAPTAPKRRNAKPRPTPPRKAKPGKRRPCGCAATGRHRGDCVGEPAADESHASRSKGKRSKGKDLRGAHARAVRAQFARPLRRCVDCGTLLHDAEAELRRHVMQEHGAGGREALERWYGPPLEDEEGDVAAVS